MNLGVALGSFRGAWDFNIEQALVFWIKGVTNLNVKPVVDEFGSRRIFFVPVPDINIADSFDQ